MSGTRIVVEDPVGRGVGSLWMWPVPVHPTDVDWIGIGGVWRLGRGLGGVV